MPLAVIGAPGVTPEQVKATGKTRVYIQGNIHAGEVEGKEALLWLLRSIAKGERAEWFKDVVLLVNPIYNADGNERVSVANRGSQWGPIGGHGAARQRPEPRPEPRLHEARDRRGPVARHAADAATTRRWPSTCTRPTAARTAAST